MVHVVKPYHMLIADDDPAFRETLRMVLEPFFEMVEAASGEEAVEIVGDRPVDIALLDMNMRVLSGLETLRILKSLNAVAPCILITADASDDLRRDATEADAYSVLAKPISRLELMTTISTAMDDTYEDQDLLALLRERGRMRGFESEGPSRSNP